MKNLLCILSLICLFSINAVAQNINQQFITDTDRLFKTFVKNGLVDYAALKDDAQLATLIKVIKNADLSDLQENSKKAFLINAYNLLVINKVAALYPINSMQDESGFFDKDKVQVAGENYTLNQLEKTLLLDVYQDARLHFVLVCAALGCPPITNFAYHPDRLDDQLDQQTKLALNNPDFIKVSLSQVALSQIFKWYADDFGGSKNAIITFINQYRSKSISKNVRLVYYDYDWTLNNISTTSPIGMEIKNNAARYIVSSTIPKGSIELKLFNNLYTQRTGQEGNLTDRSTFLTSSLSFLYGITNRFNLGFSTRYRRVRNESLPASALKVFGSGDTAISRSGLTAFGPQIRYAPFKQLSNFSIQSSFVFPIGSELEGNSTQPYIDWDGAIWTTQFFNDLAIGNSFSFFTELDFIWEDIGKSSKGKLNRVSTPVTLIFSYNPNPKITVYTLGGFSPYWQDPFDYFLQGGAGAKYQFSRNVEVELLYTGFSTKFLNDTGGKAATYNIGFRYNL